MSSTAATVLIVDDDPDVRRLLEAALKVRGFRVMNAEHGEAALRCVVHEKPRLIVLDYTMPVMDGARFLAKPFTPSLAVEVLTGLINDAAPTPPRGAPPTEYRV